MTCNEVMAQLKKLGTEQTRKTFARHGATDNFYGVKVGDLKVLQKKIKMDHALALELYATGNGDAQYLAALIADDKAFTKKNLQAWAEGASWQMISEYSVPWVAAGSPHGWELANKWIDSKKVPVATAGWNALGSIVATIPNESLNLPALKKLLDRVARTIHDQPNRVKYTMNGFVIAVGGYVEPLHDAAMAAAKKIGKVSVDVGDTDCKVPEAEPYIMKMLARGTLGRKRMSAKC